MTISGPNITHFPQIRQPKPALTTSVPSAHPSMLDVCVVGFGALGALYGFLLERSGKARVTAVCRSNFDIVKNRGIDIRSEKFGIFEGWKPYRAVKSTSEACDCQYDYIIYTAKFLPDVSPTSRVLGPLIAHTSTFVLIQNGIGIHEDLMSVTPSSVTIISACVWTYATAIDGGMVVKHGLMERLVAGIHWPVETDDAIKAASQDRLQTFVNNLSEGGSQALTTDHINSERWRKNLWNIGYSVFSTLSRASLATILNDDWVNTSAPVIRALMEEAVVIALAIGIPLPSIAIEDAIHISHMNYAETYAPRAENPTGFKAVHFKPSMLVDLEAGRPMEVEGILGGVVRKGREADVLTSRLEMAYATLRLLQESTLHTA